MLLENVQNDNSLHVCTWLYVPVHPPHFIPDRDMRHFESPWELRPSGSRHGIYGMKFYVPDAVDWDVCTYKNAYSRGAAVNCRRDGWTPE